MTLQVGLLDIDGLWLGEEDGTLDTTTTTLDGAPLGLELGNLESEGVALGWVDGWVLVEGLWVRPMLGLDERDGATDGIELGNWLNDGVWLGMLDGNLLLDGFCVFPKVGLVDNVGSAEGIELGNWLETDGWLVGDKLMEGASVSITLGIWDGWLDGIVLDDGRLDAWVLGKEDTVGCKEGCNVVQSGNSTLIS